MQLQVCWISLNSFFTKYPYINEGNGRVWKRPQKIVFCLFFIIDVLSPRLSWIERGSLKSLAHDEQLRLLVTQRRKYYE